MTDQIDLTKIQFEYSCPENCSAVKKFVAAEERDWETLKKLRDVYHYCPTCENHGMILTELGTRLLNFIQSRLKVEVLNSDHDLTRR